MLNSQSTQPIFRLLAWLFGLRSIVSGSAPARLGSAARNIQRFHLPAFAGGMRFDDAGGRIAARIMANDARPGASLSSVRQHSAHGVSTRTRSLRRRPAYVRWGR